MRKAAIQSITAPGPVVENLAVDAGHGEAQAHIRRAVHASGVESEEWAMWSVSEALRRERNRPRRGGVSDRSRRCCAARPRARAA